MMPKRRFWWRLLVVAGFVLAVRDASAQTGPTPGDAGPHTGSYAVHLPYLAMENTAATQPPGAPNGAYQRIWDENEFLSVQVPVAWEEVESGVWPPDGSAPGTYVKAAPDLDEFEAGTGPGLFLAVTHAGAPSVPATEEPAVQIRASLVQASDAAASWAAGCEQASAADYQDPFYAGVLTSYAGCVQASAPATRLMLSAMPLTQQYVVSLHIAPPAEQGQATVDRILRTFQVVAPSLTDLHHEDEHVQ